MSTGNEKHVKEKEVLYYGVSIKSWFETNMLHDIAILISSLVCMALLMFIAKDLDEEALHTHGYLLLATRVSIVCFVNSITLSITIFKKNAKYIEHTINNMEPESLKGYDKWNKISFTAGIWIFVIVSMFKYC